MALLSASFVGLLFVLLLVRAGPSAAAPSASSTAISGWSPLADGSAAALDFVLGRLWGGFADSADAVVFLCLLFKTAWDVSSAASSPDASREEGWSRSAVEDCLRDGWIGDVRFLLLEPDEDGDDILQSVSRVIPMTVAVPEQSERSLLFKTAAPPEMLRL